MVGLVTVEGGEARAGAADKVVVAVDAVKVALPRHVPAEGAHKLEDPQVANDRARVAKKGDVVEDRVVYAVINRIGVQSRPTGGNMVTTVPIVCDLVGGEERVCNADDAVLKRYAATLGHTRQQGGAGGVCAGAG